jgi:hypothetical protein
MFHSPFSHLLHLLSVLFLFPLFYLLSPLLLLFLSSPINETYLYCYIGGKKKWLSSPSVSLVKVRRDGKWTKMAPSFLVEEDTIVLEKGARAPAPLTPLSGSEQSESSPLLLLYLIPL